LVHRLWLQKYSTPLKDIDTNKRNYCELSSTIGEDILTRDVDCFTISDHIPFTKDSDSEISVTY
jgi:hypothetical protein